MSAQDDIHDFLAYIDQYGQYYYYDASDSSVSYDFPSNGFIFDPNTKALLHAPPGNWVDENDQPIVLRSKIGIPEVPTEDSKVNQPRKDVIELSLELNCIVETPLSLLRASANVQKEKAKYSAPPSFDRQMFLCSIKSFSDPEFRARFFKQHKNEGIFFRTMYSIGNVIKFTNKPITKPILRRLPRSVIPLALKCFKYILKITKVITIKKNADEKVERSLKKLIQLLCWNASLRDEVFFQLISQTTNSPNPDVQHRTWELFLAIATFFPSTRDSQLYILAHIAHVALNENEPKDIREIAQLAYIRFESRCCIGRAEDFNVIEQTNIKDLFEVDKYFKHFNASIYEIMWGQRKKVPLFLIPYILYYMTQIFINKNGLREEGIFREPGDEKIINLNASMVNEDMSCLLKMNLIDLCALIKLWFAQLTNSVVPMSFLPEFNLLCESGKYLNIPNALPKTHMHTLMYLVGFLQHILKFKEYNKFGSRELAKIFGPLLVKTTDTEPGRIATYKKNVLEFLYQLIENINTTAYYPLDFTLLC